MKLLKKIKSKRIILPLFITIVTCFLGVGFATVNGTMLDLFGIAKAIVLEEIYISDIDNNNPDDIIINSYDGTLLNSKVILDDSDIEATKSIDITLTNNTKSHQFFEEIRYQLGGITYDNNNIEVILDERLTRGYELQPKESVTFTLTFKYTEEYKDYIKDNSEEPLNNELNSILNFYFGYLIKFYQGKGNMKPDNYYLASNSTYLSEITEEIPTREGYIFMGWYDKEDYLEGQMFYDERENPTRLNDLILSSYEIKLYAGWEPIEYTITFYLNTKSNIDSNYERLEYIESTGEQSINTNVFANQNTKLETEIYGDYSNSCWYGGRNNSYIGIYNYNGGFDFGTQGTSSRIYANPKVNEWHTISHSNKLMIDNILLKEYTTTNFTSTNPIYLFAGNNGGSIVNYSQIKMKNTKIYDDDILIRDFIPVKEINGTKVGLYDEIEKKFYSSNSGNFIAGPIENNKKIIRVKYDDYIIIPDNLFSNEDVVIKSWNTLKDGSGISYDDLSQIKNLVSINNGNIDLYAVIKENALPLNNYQELEYIESTGEQYINTGIYANENIKIETEIYGDYDNVCWYGGRSTGQFVGIYNYNGGFDFGIDGTASRIYVKPVANTWHTISHSNKLIIDNMILKEYTTTNFTSDYPLYLFAGNNGGSIVNYSQIKMKNTKIYNNNILLRNFVPVKRISDSKIGFFDLVNNTFYTTPVGNFIAGPMVIN